MTNPLSMAAAPLRLNMPAPPAWRRLWQREPRLAAFAAVLFALMIPAAVGLALDERTLRDVNVWVKPMKFTLSVAVTALTTAWFAPLLPDAVRRGRAFGLLVWTLIATGGFEVGYITLQAGLGQASHYNVGDPFHAAMYTLMGIAAVALTATQPWLAWLLWRQGRPAAISAHRPGVAPAYQTRVAPAYRLAVLLGLVLTFVLGAGAGILLGGGAPAPGPGLPVLGWSRVAGDLRVAHFVGIHAGQVLPLLGFVLARLVPRAALAGVWLGTVVWCTLFAAVLLQALAGRPLIGL